MTFYAASVIQPKACQSLELIPFFRVHDARYMIYWCLASPQQYNKIVQQLKAKEQQKNISEQNATYRRRESTSPWRRDNLEKELSVFSGYRLIAPFMRVKECGGNE